MKRYISLAGALLVGTVVANEKAPRYARAVQNVEQAQLNLKESHIATVAKTF
jgi:hypothetical protein